MLIDQVVWQVINQKHCSFKIKTESQNFCRNEYNLTGLCNRHSCPLANSQYATIKQEKGICYLYMKTVQRAHTPNKLWEKVKLDKNYDKALDQINYHLQYWQPFVIHKCKQRLTKLRQMLIRMRKMKLQGYKELQPIKKKAQRRDKIRQQKALRAANIEQQIEEQLLQRLKKGVYEDIYNFNKKAFQNVMRIQDRNQQQILSQQYSQEEQIAMQFNDDKQNSVQEQQINNQQIF